MLSVITDGDRRVLDLLGGDPNGWFSVGDIVTALSRDATHLCVALDRMHREGLIDTKFEPHRLVSFLSNVPNEIHNRGAIDLSECPGKGRCTCGQCGFCGKHKHVTAHGPHAGKQPGSEPCGHIYQPITGEMYQSTGGRG